MKSTPPIISVVLTNYNHARYLDRSIARILSQIETWDELIVIDDASTDESVAVIEAYRLEDKRILFFRNETNRGVIFNLNQGITKSRGQYVLFAAADDLILPDLVPTAKASLGQYPAAAFFSAPVFIEERDLPSSKGWTTAVIAATGFVGPHQSQKALLKYGFSLTGAATVFRREGLAQMNGFCDQLGLLADTFTAHTLALTHGFCYESRPLAIVHLEKSSYGQQTRRNQHQTQAIRAYAADLMRGLYGDRYPQAFVIIWERLWQFHTHYLRYRSIALKLRQGLKSGALARSEPWLRGVDVVTQMQLVAILAWLWLRFGRLALIKHYWHTGRKRGWLNRFILLH